VHRVHPVRYGRRRAGACAGGPSCLAALRVAEARREGHADAHGASEFQPRVARARPQAAGAPSRLAVAGRGQSGDGGRQPLAEERDGVEIVVQQLLAHDPIHAGFGERLQLLGRVVHRGDDPSRRRRVDQILKA
jgi:hypothetical protein